ncbi:tryptophan halogenase family protein [Gilvimarinus polysaccharolyticus]|uniref:tryptophan halogenase family protein n=1 Tax=Gilvimarinus polysaccharolyticus TaxID=863921 RepID=UPI0006735914|nr:tryptophan halogenase family protein [Gilvimarinus polysaccharolyticus]
MHQPIHSIVILGGGTAGWLCAGTIAARVKKEHATPPTITLIESPKVPTVGVGEGTWPTMRATLRKMGIRETDFIRECHVAFKQGAQFNQWTTGEHKDSYFHPLMLPRSFSDINLAPHWLNGNTGTSFADAVCPQDTLCINGLAPKNITTPEYAAVANYAYHLDAGAFANFLRRHCVNTLGVRHISDEVTQVNSHDNGDISSLTTDNHGAISGELFIDCSGFRSRLLGQHYQVPFKSCKDVLFIDRALAVHLPSPSPDTPIASYTISTAQDNGWIWDIGLPTRRGVGHVFSSAHGSAEQAYQNLARYAAQSGHDIDKLSVREIPIEPGHRTKFWQNNCVAVGLSAGFLEPLEASALVLVEISADMIASQLPATRSTMDIVAKRFNKTFLYRWQRIIDFLKLHYCLSKRDDSDFWRDNRSNIPSDLQELLALWQFQAPWDSDFDQAIEVFPAASYQYVLYGMGFTTDMGKRGLSKEQQQRAEFEFIQNRQTSQQLARALPDHRELLNKIYQHGLSQV